MEASGELSLHPINILRFERLFEEAMDKIDKFSGSNYTIKEKLKGFEEEGRLRIFIEYATEFICQKTNPSIHGPCGLSYDYYLSLGGFFRNAPFLFGTPSQFH